MEDAVGKSKEELNKFCQDFNFIGWYATSAKENKNIDECSKFLVSKILEVYKPVVAQQPEEEVLFFSFLSLFLDFFTFFKKKTNTTG